MTKDTSNVQEAEIKEEKTSKKRECGCEGDKCNCKKKDCDCNDKNCKCNKHDHGVAGKVFWGLLLILIGGAMIADNFGVINADWSNLWRLWPIFIIAAGFSILSFKNIIWKILSVMFALATIAVICWALIGDTKILNQTTQTYETTIQKISNDIKSADVKLEVGASNVDIDSDSGDYIVNATLKSNGLTLGKKSVMNDDVQNITLSMGENNWFPNIENDWDINLTKELPVSLRIDSGASDIKADLSDVQLSSLELDTGASNLSIKIGDNQKVTNIDIDSGASSITINIPKDSGVRLTSKDGLSNLELVDLSKISEGLYQSSNYTNAKNLVIITSDSGVSSITIKRY